MKEIWSGHEKLTDRQMDGQTDDQCLDIKLAIPNVMRYLYASSTSLIS